MAELKSTNGISVPDKEFYDIGVAVDTCKLNTFSKALGKDGAGFTVLIIGAVSPGVTMLKVMQVPKAELENLSKLIKRLDHSIKHSN